MKEKVSKRSEIPTGKVKVITVEGQNIALCNVRGSIYAIEDVCSHDGAALDQGELMDNVIECPRHGAQFDVTNGNVLCLPAVTPLRTYPVSIEGEDVYVEVTN